MASSGPSSARAALRPAYLGPWLPRARHVSSAAQPPPRCHSLSSVKDRSGEYRKQYAGGWARGMQHGHGTMFYGGGQGERYEGEWFEDERSGWGRMFYADGSIYEGEWLGDQRCGRGLYLMGEESGAAWSRCLRDKVEACVEPGGWGQLHGSFFCVLSLWVGPTARFPMGCVAVRSASHPPTVSPCSQPEPLRGRMAGRSEARRGRLLLSGQGAAA